MVLLQCKKRSTSRKGPSTRLPTTPLLADAGDAGEHRQIQFSSFSVTMGKRGGIPQKNRNSKPPEKQVLRNTVQICIDG